MYSKAEDVQNFLWTNNAIELSYGSITCKWCDRSTSLVASLADTMHYTCEQCWKTNKNYYEQITQSDAYYEYGLTSSSLGRAVSNKEIAVSQVKTRNQRNAKLYYRFQLVELAKLNPALSDWPERRKKLEDARLNKLLSQYGVTGGDDRTSKTTIKRQDEQVKTSTSPEVKLEVEDRHREQESISSTRKNLKRLKLSEASNLRAP